MRNLTTTGLGEKRVKQRRASQSPLRVHSVQLGVVKEEDKQKQTTKNAKQKTYSKPSKQTTKKMTKDIRIEAE